MLVAYRLEQGGGASVGPCPRRSSQVVVQSIVLLDRRSIVRQVERWFDRLCCGSVQGLQRKVFLLMLFLSGRLGPLGLGARGRSILWNVRMPSS